MNATKISKAFDIGRAQNRRVTRNGAPAAVRLPDPAKSAKAARLLYVSDDTPGIKRSRRGKGFVYTTQDGKILRDSEELRRFKSLSVPPAWRDVWICPLPQGHLQATGRDAKGRKQHRYHPAWREIRDQTKYHRMLAFGRALPALRRRVKQDLALLGLPREKLLATVVRLLETSMARVGNEQYRRQNNSFGLATLRSRHVNVTGSNIRFEFRGKSGIRHAFDLNDLRLAKIIKRCQELPGHELFQYVDADEKRHTIDSADVNEYLRQIAGEEFSSKDFRTWCGTVLAVRALSHFHSGGGKAQHNKNIQQAIDSVAKRLGNTKAVCRKCYIHPAVIEAYKDGSLLQAWKGSDKHSADNRGALAREEVALLTLIKRQPKLAHSADGESRLRKQLRQSLRGRKSASLAA